MPRYRVRAALWVKFLVVFFGLFTLGTMPLFFWLLLRNVRITWIDDQGVTTMSGRTLRWEDLTHLHTGITVGAPVAVRTFRLDFGPRSAAILGTFERGGGREAMALVHRILADRGVRVVEGGEAA